MYVYIYMYVYISHIYVYRSATRRTTRQQLMPFAPASVADAPDRPTGRRRRSHQRLTSLEAELADARARLADAAHQLGVCKVEASDLREQCAPSAGARYQCSTHSTRSVRQR